MTPQQQSILALIEAAGAAGVSRDHLATAMQTTPNSLKGQICRMREAGIGVYASWRQDGGLYFAQKDWKEAADVARSVQVKANRKARMARRDQKRVETQRLKRQAERAARAATVQRPRTVKPKKSAQCLVLHDVRANVPGLRVRGAMPPEMAGGLDRGPRATGAVHQGPIKVTVLPSAPVYARHQVAPGERVWGAGFASLPMGKYVDEAASCAARAAG